MASRTDSIDDTLDAIAGAIAHEIEEHMNTEEAFSNVGVITVGTVDMDDAILPGRLEDVEHYAKRIADAVARDVRDVVERIAADMLRTLMSQP